MQIPGLYKLLMPRVEKPYEFFDDLGDAVVKEWSAVYRDEKGNADYIEDLWDLLQTIRDYQRKWEEKFGADYKHRKKEKSSRFPRTTRTKKI